MVSLVWTLLSATSGRARPVQVDAPVRSLGVDTWVHSLPDTGVHTPKWQVKPIPALVMARLVGISGDQASVGKAA